MNDKIIEAAKSAGWNGVRLELACPNELERLSAFYAIAYRQGLEDAAKLCDSEANRSLINWRDDLPINQNFWNGGESIAKSCAESIRNLKDKDHG